MSLTEWTGYYREHEAQRLRDWARMVGIVHAQKPRAAQRDLLRSAARVSGGRRGIDLLAEPRKLRERLRKAGIPGVAVETKPAPGGTERPADETPEG